MECASVKPPNVVVFTGEDSSKGKCPRYENIAKSLKFCLHPDCYTVYLLTPSQAAKDPWLENVTLLVVSCDEVDECVLQNFRSFVLNGGKLLNFCSKLDLHSSSGVRIEGGASHLTSIKYKDVENVSALSGRHSFKWTDDCSVLGFSTDENRPVIGKIKLGKGQVLMSQVTLEVDPVVLDLDRESFTALKESNAQRLDIVKDILSSEFGLNCSSPIIPKLTPCYLLTNEDASVRKLVSADDSEVSDKFHLKFFNMLDATSFPEAADSELPVLYNVSSGTMQSVPFDRSVYFDSLNTKTFGRKVFFVEVVGSTMDVVANISEWNGAVVVARRQVQGRGRGGNKWISPEGCAMFSTHFTVPLSSPLAGRLPIVQHFAALSIVLGVRKTPGYENLDLRLKWPNDIYFGKQHKIGGILVNTNVRGNFVHFYTGSGLNVNNSQPTLCLNDIIQFHNKNTGDHLSPFTVEQLIACSLNELEILIDKCQGNDLQQFFSDYHSCWLHADQKVSLGESDKTATVLRLDECGFLLVKTEKGEAISLQPDGNSFDMIRNLIVVKN